MGRATLKNLYIIFIFLLPLLIMGVLLLITQVQYNTLVKWIAVSLNKGWIEGFLREQIFTIEKFRIIRKCSYVAMLALPLISFFLFKKRENAINVIYSIFTEINSIWKGVIRTYRACSKNQKLVLGIFFLLVSAKCIYYIITWDLSYDEMWCYNYFTSSPIYFSVFMYNNYPLYELATGLFKYLPFSAKINMRLPVLMMGLMACFIFYPCLKKIFHSHLIAFSGIVIFAFMPITAAYAFRTRSNL